MNRIPLCLLTASLLVACVLPASAAPKTMDFSDRKVTEAIERAKKIILSAQDKDGTWGGKGNYPYGVTSLATVALLSAGESPQSAPLKKALEFLSKGCVDPISIDKKDIKNSKGPKGGSVKTYSLGLMGNCFHLANEKTNGAYRRQLRWVTTRLVKSTKNGSYGYTSLGSEESSGDNSNSQYGLLGVWGGALGKEEVPRKYWWTIMQHWLEAQNGDGGWGYKNHENSRNTMVAAGVASLFVCFDNLFADAFVKCETSSHFSAIQRGLDWFDRNFADSQGRIDIGGRGGYYLYGVERVGLASGYKYFGEADWYKLGVQWVLPKVLEGRHNGNEHVINMSFYLLFLARGRHPVFFNKLEFEGDWNNRPRDLAAVTRKLSEDLEFTPAWQIINLKVPVSEWHDAPILYISGADAPKFSDEDIAKIRRYVLQGGTILSVTECPASGGKAFADGIRKAYTRMFPKRELTPLGPDHPLYSRSVQNELKGQPAFHMISNGVRPFVIHTDEDLSLHWQLKRYSSRAKAFEAAQNIVFYVTDKADPRRVRHRGVSHWPDEPTGTAVATVKVARLKHSGNYNPEPLAYERLSRLFAKQTGIKLEVGEPVSPLKLGESGAKIALMTGTGHAKLTEDEQQALKKFVEGGGTVVIDAAGGNDTFSDDMRKMLRTLFNDVPLKLGGRSPVYNVQGVPQGKVRYRLASEKRYQLQPYQSGPPVLKAILVQGRPAVIVSDEDITGGLVGYLGYGIRGYDPGNGVDNGTAYRLMRDIILHASPEAHRKMLAAQKTADKDTRGKRK
ncbi:MAG: DUF4159 domain-containing protein [Phycisphaerae bacterium]